MRKLAFGFRAAVVLSVVMLTGCVGGGSGHDRADGLKSPHADVRRERVLELGRNRPWGAGKRKTLVNTLHAMGQSDPDPLVRCAALASLQRLDSAASITLARELITDTDPMVRCDAAKALSAGSGDEARSGLLYAVEKDPSRDVRREAARGLGRFSDDEVVRKLINLLADGDPGVVVAACRSLQRISGLDMGARLGQWQEWYDRRDSIPAPELVSEPDSPSEKQLVKPADEPADEVPPPVRKKIEDVDVEELRRHRR